MKSRLQSAGLDRLTLCRPPPDIGQRMTLGAAIRGDATPRRMAGKAVGVQCLMPALERTGAQHQMRVANGQAQQYRKVRRDQQQHTTARHDQFQNSSALTM